MAALTRDLGNFKISGCPRKGKKTHTHIWVNLPCDPSPAAAFIIPPRQLTQDQLFALARAGTYARWVNEEAALDRMERSGAFVMLTSAHLTPASPPASTPASTPN